jgi:hypothetical protein
MSYRVFWSPYAEEKFEQLLLESGAAKSKVVAAARDIDHFLASDPIGFGEFDMTPCESDSSGRSAFSMMC